MDLILQATGGLMGHTGEPDGPPIKSAPPVADMTTGMYAAYGILGALLERERSGEGQKVEVAMLDAVVSLFADIATNVLTTGTKFKKFGSGHPDLVPYQAFPAKDGFFIVACLTNAFWKRLCVAIGREDGHWLQGGLDEALVRALVAVPPEPLRPDTGRSPPRLRHRAAEPGGDGHCGHTAGAGEPVGGVLVSEQADCEHRTAEHRAASIGALRHRPPEADASRGFALPGIDDVVLTHGARHAFDGRLHGCAISGLNSRHVLPPLSG
jgi:hypothetical protein